ncbi:MAG TPA: alpha/beta hydrolase, partial [Pseudolysinimonas sp.]
NRSFLSATIAGLESQIADGSAGRAATEDLQAQLHMLQQVSAALETGESGLHHSLINLDVNDGGRAVIAVGDLASAQYVSYLVPGMFYSVDSEIGSWARAADELAADQAAWLDRLSPNQYPDSASAVATVAWIGYHTPTVVNVASLDLAREGRDALTASLRGLDAIRSAGAADGVVADKPYLSILAHSYGATAALLALQENDVTVDALAMVGSPGSPAESVGQLKVRGGNVWVADASWDPVASTGVFGSQPLSPEYGAHHFGVDGVIDPLTGATLAGSVGHVDYFTYGSESFRNMALISIGRAGFVLDPDGVVDAAPRAQASAR